LARRSVLHLRFQERASAHFDVHDVWISEAGQQILQFDERLSVVLDFPVILGHDVPQIRLVGQRLVHVALRAAAALFPYGAQTGRSETVRVSGQLEPRLWLWLLLLDAAAGRGPARTTRRLRDSGNGLRGLYSRFDVRRHPRPPGGGGCGGRRAGVVAVT